MANIYDARGNRYAVATPTQVIEAGIDLPLLARHAAALSTHWASAAIAEFCQYEAGRAAKQTTHETDGLLIGPFQNTAPFDLLIINTDGSLAERSGNGLTIFSQSLIDAGLIKCGASFTVNVHHHGRDIHSPVSTSIKSAEHNGHAGFWLDMGAPGFGPAAVGARDALKGSASQGVNTVEVLEAINSGWTRSVFVRLGNPHCVSLVDGPDELPDMNWLGSAGLAALSAIAFSSAAVSSGRGKGLGDPCPNGINLQWATKVSERRIMACVFERGEGPTLSSGTSACAVASAMWRSGQILAGDSEVEMPGGTAPIRLLESDGELVQVQLFGVAEKWPTCSNRR